MKKQLQFFKVALFLLLFFVIVVGVKAQNSCSTALQINEGCNQYQVAANQNAWFTFVADSLIYEVSVNASGNNPSSHITDLYLYGGSCNNHTALKHLNLNEGDSSFMILRSLQAGQTYYILVEHSDSISSYFKICFAGNTKNKTTLSCPPTNCEYVMNSEFNTVPNYNPSYTFEYEQVCGWHAMMETPSIQGQSPTTYARLWAEPSHDDPTWLFGEAIQQYLSIPLNSTTTYQFSFDWKIASDAYSPMDNFFVYLVDTGSLYTYSSSTHFNNWYGYPIHEPGNGGLLDQLNLLVNLGFAQPLGLGNAAMMNLSNNSWTHVSFTFQCSNPNLRGLVLFPMDHDITPSPDANGGSDILIDNVHISAIAPTITVVPNPAFVCHGSSITLHAYGATTYDWMPGPLSGSSITINNATTSTIYTVTGHNGIGCTGSTTVPVNVMALPNVTVNATSNPICQGQSTTLIAHGAQLYSWGSTYSTANSITVTPTATTTYTVIGIANNGCTASATVTVNVGTPQPFTISGSNSACDNLPNYHISNYSGTGNWSLSLLDNGNTISLGNISSANFVIDWNQYPSGGTIIVTHTDIIGCISSDSLLVYPCCTRGIFANYTDTTISSTYIFPIGATIGINGTFTITGANTLVSMSTVHVYLGKNARINIESNARLEIIRGSVLEACSGIMWDGIYIENHTATLQFYESTIMDAKNAVVSKDGGLYEIGSNSIFDKNYKGIVVKPYMNNHLGIVEQTHFDCSAPLLPQDPPVANNSKTFRHIEIDRVKNIEIGTPHDITIIDNSNTFKNSMVGIYAYNSGVTIINNNFQNFNNSFMHQLNGYAIVAKSIVNSNNITTKIPFMPFLYVGEYDHGGYIYKNTFTDCDNGIFSDNIHDLRIINNSFQRDTANTFGNYTRAIRLDETFPYCNDMKLILNNYIDKYSSGIWLDNINCCNISSNYITNIYPLSVSSASGIYCNACNSTHLSDNQIINASYTPNTYGIIRSVGSTGNLTCNHTKYMQDGIYYSGGSMPGVVQVNEMANCKYGIHLSHGAVIGNQGWQAGLPPHNYDNPNDNLWIQPLSGGYDLFTSDATDGTQSKFYNNTGTPYSNPTSSAQNPPNSIPIPIDFTNGASSIACATSLPVSNLNKEFLENIIKDMVYFAQFQDENTIIGQDNVYIDLRKVDTNNLSQVMKDFIDICQQSDFAKIEEVNRLIREGKMLEADSINNLINENDRSINATRQINSLLINASVDTVNLEYTFKDDELHLLREIASLCPYEYGRAVSLARSILFTIDTNVYFNDCEAESFVVEQRSLKTDNDTSSNIIIYPNPVKNQLFIDQETNVKLHVEIFNVLGVRVYSNDLFDMHNIVQLDNMNAGIYYVKLSQNGEVVKEKKLTIIK